MKLYHTSMLEFDKIDLNKAKLYKDFGRGFYLTPDEMSSLNFLKQNSGNLYTYLFDMNEEYDLKILTFKTKEEWFDYVYLNRTTNHTDDYDLVIGYTASNCYKQFKEIRNGKDIKLNVDELLDNNHGTQFCFKTEHALSKLFLESHEKLDKYVDFY